MIDHASVNHCVVIQLQDIFNVPILEWNYLSQEVLNAPTVDPSNENVQHIVRDPEWVLGQIIVHN